MGRELQKKKNRSSINKVRMKPKSKKINPRGNPIVAANWNQNETLTQNYRRLGLASKLNAATGGIEKPSSKNSTVSAFAIANAVPTTFTPTEARVERDPETGKITRVVHNEKANPLNDPLLTDDEDEEDVNMQEAGTEKVGIIAELERLAARAPEKKPRQQSTREKEWIEKLVSKYGEDTKKMSRDMKLNPMQQTEADIRRRIQRWKGQA